MHTPRLPEGFSAFLMSAKQNTYASSDDDTTMPNPLLEQSMQLEYRDEDWFYRDIYFGMSYFSGMETVYLSGKALWSMVYSGGTSLNTDVADSKRIYTFLRSALRNPPGYFPIRGPAVFSNSEYDYKMKAKGDLVAFSGREDVRCNGKVSYALTFSGGVLR